LNSNNKQQQHNKQKYMVEWRREKVLLLVSQGYSQRDIAGQIKVSVGTVNKDLSYLREQARENIKKYVDEKIPEEYEKCLTGLNSILRESWSMSNTAVDKREKIEALKLARDCYSMRLDLLTNSNVINDSIRFIEKSKNNEKENLSNKKENIDQSDIQRPTEDNSGNESTINYNQTF
jgi:hypothetical protein